MSMMKVPLKSPRPDIVAYNRMILGEERSGRVHFCELKLDTEVLRALAGFFQGDDMGFNTGTLMPPDLLRKHVLPWHKKIAALAHEQGLPYILHSSRPLCSRFGELDRQLRSREELSYDAGRRPALAEGAFLAWPGALPGAREGEDKPEVKHDEIGRKTCSLRMLCSPEVYSGPTYFASSKAATLRHALRWQGRR